jgi:hypothetical protein
MTERWRNPFFLFGLVLLWRLVLLVFTAQPIPANDAFFFDGPVVNLLRHGHYVNPAIAEVLPISGRQVYSAYPPLYQSVLLIWMSLFGASVIAAMTLHLALFAASGFLSLAIVTRLFPPATNYALIVLLFFGMTFGDRPDDLGHAFGLGALFLVAKNISGGGNWKTNLGLVLVLFGALYSTVIVGAFYFGAGFLTVAAAWLTQRKNIFSPPPFYLPASRRASRILNRSGGMAFWKIRNRRRSAPPAFAPRTRWNSSSCSAPRPYFCSQW